MVSYAITGASRGLGFEYIRQLSQTPSNVVFAIVRNTTSSTKLTALASSNSNVHIVQGDITSLEQIQAAANTISEITGGSLDVLVNNAAFLDTVTASMTPTQLTNPENLEVVKKNFHVALDTNVLGAIYVTNAFLPLILKGAEKKIIHISSGMGDVDLVLKGGIAFGVPYSSSKAMLNLVVAKYAAELGEKGVTVVALSPGWVDTDVEEATPETNAIMEYLAALFRKIDPNVKGRIEPEESVRCQIETIRKVEVENSGKMISHHGNQEWF